MQPKLSALLALSLLLGTFALVTSAATPFQVLLSSNVTSIQPGQPFTAQCQVLSYDVKGSETLYFEFIRENSTHVDYLIDYHFDVDGTGQRHWSTTYNYTNHADLSIQLHPQTTFPICEVTFLATRQSEYQYYCLFGSGSSHYAYSNRI